MRYSRQIVIPGVGEKGQARLKAGSVLIIGAGGLGSPAALYLAGAGIGRIGLIDGDRISLSNLQRQILYSTDKIGSLKVDEARKRLLDLNPELDLTIYPYFASNHNIDELVLMYNVILDGSDNFKTRCLVSEACLRHEKPYIYGGIFQFEGHLAVFSGQGAPCYRCLFPEIPTAGEVPNCNEAGVLGPLPGMIGSLQAMEVLKFLLGLSSKTGRLFVFDALALESRALKIQTREDCAFCSPGAKLKPKRIFIEPLFVEVDQPLPEGVEWLDVRETHEFERHHIKGARNIPLAQLEAELHTLLPHSRYVIYCTSGQRSASAQDLLLSRGHSFVWNLRGGLNAQKVRFELVEGKLN